MLEQCPEWRWMVNICTMMTYETSPKCRHRVSRRMILPPHLYPLVLGPMTQLAKANVSYFRWHLSSIYSLCKLYTYSHTVIFFIYALLHFLHCESSLSHFSAHIFSLPTPRKLFFGCSVCITSNLAFIGKRSGLPSKPRISVCKGVSTTPDLTDTANIYHGLITPQICCLHHANPTKAYRYFYIIEWKLLVDLWCLRAFSSLTFDVR